jgi:hypothetical protein
MSYGQYLKYLRQKSAFIQPSEWAAGEDLPGSEEADGFREEEQVTDDEMPLIQTAAYSDDDILMMELGIVVIVIIATLFGAGRGLHGQIIFGSIFVNVRVGSRRKIRGSYVEKELSLNISDSLFYVDAWRSHWCPYYNERTYYLFPRVNEILHLARSRGFPVLHLHWVRHESRNDSQKRRHCRALNAIGLTQIIAKNDIKVDRKTDGNWLSGFSDKCVYKEYNGLWPMGDRRPNPDISVAESDYIGFDFKSVANIANALKIKRIIMLGVHTNMCIRWVSTYCSWLGIESIFVEGLLDSAYWYPGQVLQGVTSHTRMNQMVYRWFAKDYGYLVKEYDLIRSLRKVPPVHRVVNWILYDEQILPFARFYVK